MPGHLSVRLFTAALCQWCHAVDHDQVQDAHAAVEDMLAAAKALLAKPEFVALLRRQGLAPPSEVDPAAVLHAWLRAATALSMSAEGPVVQPRGRSLRITPDEPAPH